MPLARWTMGKVGPLGWKILGRSLELFRRVYPEFDMVVCHNHLTDGEVARLEKFHVPLRRQDAAEFGHPLLGPSNSLDVQGEKASGWKLVPPRLAPGDHELFIDNDVIVDRRVPTVDRWLEGGGCLISTGLKRMFGRYDGLVRAAGPLNAGFVGVPPGFDFGSRIAEYLRHMGGEAFGHFDEQGLVAAVLTEGRHLIIPPGEMAVLAPDTPVPDPLPAGFHFIVANRDEGHGAFHEYRRRAVRLG